MIIVDSNILIYSASDQFETLRKLIRKPDMACSVISKLEVLGYYRITDEQTAYFEALFKVMNVLPVSDVIINQAIIYRRRKAMSVGDAIVAATVKVSGETLYTNNIEDFRHIKDFKIINPIKKSK